VWARLKPQVANPEHLAKLEEGVEAWNKWREENPSVKPDLSQAHLENARLFRARLENANLRLARLEDANLIGAHLENADLNTAHLENAILRRAHLENASLFRAHFENADLTQSHLENAHLTEAHLENADLREADLTNSDVTGLLYTGPASLQEKRMQRFSAGGSRWWNWLRRNPIPYRRWVMRGHYQGIRGLSACHGNRIFVRDATDQDYLDTVEEQLRTPWGRFRFWLWGITDYGRSLMSVVVFASILIFGFGWVYSHSPRVISVGDRRVTPFTPYYFSIVTYTTLGFGDVKPNNLAGEVLVSVEVILGNLTLGLLLAVLGDKVARRG
jgi:hypothetical protein